MPRCRHIAARHCCHIATTSPPHRRHTAVTLPPHRRHIAAILPPHWLSQLPQDLISANKVLFGPKHDLIGRNTMWLHYGGDMAAMWRQCGGDVAVVWGRCGSNVWRRCGGNVASSSCRRHVVVRSSSCRSYVVAMLASLHRHVVVTSSSCRHHVLAMPSPSRLTGVVASLPSTSGCSLTEAFRL